VRKGWNKRADEDGGERLPRQIDASPIINTPLATNRYTASFLL
jgi:hypothetical protein